MKRRRRRNPVDPLATRAPSMPGKGAPLSKTEKLVMGGAFLLGIAATWAFVKQVRANNARGSGDAPPPRVPGSWGAPGYKAPPPGTPASAWSDTAMPPGTPGGSGNGDGSAPVPPSQYAAWGTGDDDMARTNAEQGGQAFMHN